MKTSWQQYFSRPNKRIYFFASLLGLVITLVAFIYFLTFNENRTGYLFNDPILILFKPVAFSEIIFFLTYFFAVYGIIILFREPQLFVGLIQAYTIMTLIRMFCLYVFPLEPPFSIIPLKDTFLQSSFYSGRENLKDLFFSGHTATIFLFVFIFKRGIFKILFATGGFVIGVLLVLQHVHYSIDVLVAPLFAFIAVKVQRKINIQ